MSSELSFRCPVCRAEQTLRDTCRRCHADLTLVARAHRRVAYLLTELAHVRDGHDAAREQLVRDELRRLAPHV